MPRDCLNDETIMDYIENRLPNGIRAKVDDHLCDCADCRDMLMLAVDLNADEMNQASEEVPAEVTQRAVDAVRELSEKRSGFGHKLVTGARRLFAKGAALTGDMTPQPMLQPAPLRSGVATDNLMVIHKPVSIDGIDVLIEIQKTTAEQFSIKIALAEEIKLDQGIGIELLAGENEVASTSLRDVPVFFEEIPTGHYTLTFSRTDQQIDTFRFELA